MKIYPITPAFDIRYIPKIEEFFAEGNIFLQLRDKTAGLPETERFITAVMEASAPYPNAEIILNSYNNFTKTGKDLVEYYGLAGEQHSTASLRLPLKRDKRINFLSAHNMNDIICAEKNNFDFITLSPVFYTLSHPENTTPLGLNRFRELCEKSKLPVFALGGITEENFHLFENIKNCSGAALIRGFFS